MKLFKHKEKPKEQVLYAITDGEHMGMAVVFINPEKHPVDGIYPAMIIGGKDLDGGMDSINLTEKDVFDGLRLGILDKIRKVPKELYELCCSEYYEREKRKEESDECTD